MKKDSFFKFLFWMLTILIFGIAVIGISIGTWALSQEPEAPTFVALIWWFMIIFFGAIVAGISVFVYNDAGKRGLNQWMWMTIAVYVPNFIGIVLYMITRNNEAKCFNCGKGIKKEFDVCPYCGSKVKSQCGSCGKTVESSWQICPYCANKLK